MAFRSLFKGNGDVGVGSALHLLHQRPGLSVFEPYCPKWRPIYHYRPQGSHGSQTVLIGQSPDSLTSYRALAVQGVKTDLASSLDAVLSELDGDVVEYPAKEAAAAS